jgi:hypothetical protein
MGAVIAVAAHQLPIFQRRAMDECSPLLPPTSDRGHMYDDDDDDPPLRFSDIMYHACPISKAVWELACFFALELPQCDASELAHEWLHKTKTFVARAATDGHCTTPPLTRACFASDNLEQPKKAVSRRVAMLADILYDMPPTHQRNHAIDSLHEARTHALIAVDWVAVPRHP